jgi:hypothetical protein
MTTQVIVMLLLAVFGGFWTLTKLLMTQTLKQLDARFLSQDTARTKAQEHWESRFSQIEALARSNERDLLVMRGDLPNQYLRREDYIRGQSTIEAKLDAIATELKLVQIKRGND